MSQHDTLPAVQPPPGRTSCVASGTCEECGKYDSLSGISDPDDARLLLRDEHRNKNGHKFAGEVKIAYVQETLMADAGPDQVACAQARAMRDRKPATAKQVKPPNLRVVRNK